MKTIDEKQKAYANKYLDMCEMRQHKLRKNAEKSIDLFVDKVKDGPEITFREAHQIKRVERFYTNEKKGTCCWLLETYDGLFFRIEKSPMHFTFYKFYDKRNALDLKQFGELVHYKPHHRSLMTAFVPTILMLIFFYENFYIDAECVIYERVKKK